MSKPSASILKIAADLAGAAYTTWPGDKDAVCAGNVYAKVYYIGGNTYISVRGTDDVRDMFGNIPVPLGTAYGTVHAGYWAMAQRIHGWAVGNPVEGDLILTGHSLGGGVAMMLPLISPLIADQLNHIITFGSPKCVQGSYPFADKLTRVVRRLDVVPHLPPFGKWEHVGRELMFTNDGKPYTRRVGEDALRWAEWIYGAGIYRMSGLRSLSGAALAKVRQWHSCEGYSICRFGE